MSEQLYTSESIARFKAMGMGTTACPARVRDLVCCLDVIHNEYGSLHVHRNADGTLMNFRSTES
jgi:hypothetical protein